MFKKHDDAGADALGERLSMPLIGDAAVLQADLVRALRAARPRPFAAFRGDVRKPPRRRAKAGQADIRRVYAMQIAPDRASTIAKLQRGLRIIARAQAIVR